MPICRLQKNHALTRRGGLSPLFRLIHPQPLMTQAKQNKERFIYRRSARSLVSLALSLSLLSTPFSFYLSLFLPFLHHDGSPVSFALFLSSSSHASTRPYGFLHSLALDAVSLFHLYPLIASVCLSILPIPPPFTLSLFSRRGLLARSLTCAQMKSIKMLGATSRQSCSTPTPASLSSPSPPFPAVVRLNLRQTPTPTL